MTDTRAGGVRAVERLVQAWERASHPAWLRETWKSLLFAQPARELGPGPDVELPVHLRQRGLDGVN
jgi:hypothetical protein